MIDSAHSDPVPDDDTVVDMVPIPTARQRLFALLTSTMHHRASLTLYASNYSGDLRRDFLRWVERNPQYQLMVGETRVVTDWGWSRLVTADSPVTHLRAISIYYPTVMVPVIDLGGA